MLEKGNYRLILSWSKIASSNLQLKDVLSHKWWFVFNSFQMWFPPLHHPRVLQEHSEFGQTAFRASHGEARGLGNLNCVMLCKEIILLCSLILPLASFIWCPLAQGSTELFLMYLFHSTHYFIKCYKSFLQPFAFQTEEYWSNHCSLDNVWSQILLWQLGRKGIKLLCAQATGTSKNKTKQQKNIKHQNTQQFPFFP